MIEMIAGLAVISSIVAWIATRRTRHPYLYTWLISSPFWSAALVFPIVASGGSWVDVLVGVVCGPLFPGMGIGSGWIRDKFRASVDAERARDERFARYIPKSFDT